jgi:VWFA-related protein
MGVTATLFLARRWAAALTLFVATASLTFLLAPGEGSQAMGQASPSAPGAATEVATPGTQVPAPAIRVNTRLVEVNVVVKDRKGNPITDLTKDDFTVLDGNKPQAISDFSVQATHLTAGLVEPAAKNTFTNRFEDQTGVPTSVTVVLFDALNTHFRDLAYAREQMLKFIAQIHPEDRVAIFGLADDLVVLQGFTSDQQALINAVRKSTTPENEHAEATDVQPSDTASSNLDEFMDQVNQLSSDFYDRDSAIRTSEALTAIASYIGRLPGRKNLIWISSAFPLEINLDKAMTHPSTTLISDESDTSAATDAGASTAQPDRETFDDELEAAAEALDNADIAVYPVDARGLIPAPSMVSSRHVTPVTRASRGGQITPIDLPSTGNFDTMNEIADRTGGRAFYNTNDIAGSVQKAIDDSRVTYVLSYYPDHGEWDGKFREIKIKVDRPGMDARYRRGYFAVADAAPAPVKRHVLLQGALNSPVDSSAIGMTAVAHVFDDAGVQSLRVRIHLDSQAIALVPDGDHWHAVVDFAVAQWDTKNKLLKVQTPSFVRRVTQAQLATLDKVGFDVQFETDLVAGASRVRYAGCDEQSGATGSVTIPIGSLALDSR